MAIVRDCGDFSAKLGFTLSLEFPPYVDSATQSKISDALSKLGPELQQRRERVEMEFLDYVCDQLGYPEDVVRKLVDTRTNEQNDAIEREKEGRAEKNRRRGGR